jgi:selenocysteine lyase/cysteine desulfurase
VVITPTLDAGKLRADFPIFEQRLHRKTLAYLDSATSAQKPKVRAFVNATSTQGFSSCDRRPRG